MQMLTKNHLTFLFDFIDEAKSSGCFKMANLAFACLLDLALDRSDIKIIWESQNNSLEDTWEIVENDSYYDLVVISDGKQDACIPVPLLRSGVQKACFLDAKDNRNFWDLRPHNRQVKKCLPGQVDYLAAKLSKKFPNYQQLGEKYLDESE